MQNSGSRYYYLFLSDRDGEERAGSWQGRNLGGRRVEGKTPRGALTEENDIHHCRPPSPCILDAGRGTVCLREKGETTGPTISAELQLELQK